MTRASYLINEFNSAVSKASESGSLILLVWLKMAEGPDLATKTAQELEQEITYGICHDYYEEPKVFPCCHYYCKQCITNLASRYPPNQPFPCPDCREPTLLPDNDPDKLPTAFFINRMKVLHSRMEKASGRVEALCEMCSGGGKSVALCRQCVQFICSDCVKTHKKIKIFAGHKIATLEELKQGGTSARVLHFEEAPPPKCTTHDEAMKLYCSDCSKLICRDCVIIDHAGHKYEFIRTAAPETRKQLIAQAAPLKEIASEMLKAAERMKTARNAVETSGKSVTNTINSYFDELQKILEDRRTQLLDESSQIVKEKVENLTAQEKDITLSLATVQSLTDFVERTLANASDEEVVTMHTQVLSRIKGEVEKQKQGTATQKPVVVETDFGVKLSLSEELRELCLANSKIVTVAGFDPRDCTVAGNGVRLAEVDKSERVVVSTYLPRELDVRGELRSLVNGSIQPLQLLSQTDTAKYTLQYTPKVRGRHQLSITVNGGHILGSPFSMFVRIPPTKLGKQVRVIENIRHASYIVFNSSEEMIVTRYDQGIDVLDKTGTKLHSIRLAENGMKSAEGVAVDKDDNIYVTDREGCCLVKFNKRMKLVKKLEGKVGSVRIKKLSGVAVHDERVLVCNRGNNRVIVLNRDLEFIKEIGRGGSGNGQFNGLQDITTDKQGNMYVSDQGNHRVQIFTSEGEHIRTIRSELDPVGVFVDDLYLYIVDHSQQHIVVCTKEGHYVTLFGKLPSNPNGIAMDSDGFFLCALLTLIKSLYFKLFYLINLISANINCGTLYNMWTLISMDTRM